MTAIQTLKNARTLAAKEVEHARKAHTKFKTQAEAFNKAFTSVKETLVQAEVNLKAIDDTLKTMGEIKTPAAPVKVAERKTPKVRAKKAAKAAPAKKAAKVQAKTKAPSKKAASKKGASRQATGRREVAEGKRPTIRDAIIKVMGTKVMSRQQVFDLLKAKGWLPNSNDPLGYVGYLLSATKAKDGGHLFERAVEKGRGFYRVKQEAAAALAVAPTAPKAKRKYTRKAAAAAPKAEAEAKAVQPKAEVNGVTPEKSTDQILKEAGIGTDDAPFG